MVIENYGAQAGSWRLVGEVHPDLGQIVAVGLGKNEDDNGMFDEENIDMKREAVRKAAAAGIKAVSDIGEKHQSYTLFLKVPGSLDPSDPGPKWKQYILNKIILQKN